MKIDSLSLSNFRNFEEAQFEFPTNFTVIIGENGMGKSSLLQGLRLAASTFLLGIDEAERYHIQREDVRRIDLEHRFVPQNNCSFSASGWLNGVEISWKRTLSRMGGRTDVKNAAALIDLAKTLNDQVNHQKIETVDLPVINFFSTARLWVDAKQTFDLKKKGSRLKDGYARCVDDRSDKGSAMEWIKSAYWKKLKDKQQANLLLDAVFEALAICVPNWTPTEWDEDTDNLGGVYVNPQGQESFVPLSYLSDGLRTMGAMVAEIAYRCVILNTHYGRHAVKESRGVVLIDEIDMHLHPNWQRKVVSNLKLAFPNLQFIATTHSPFIVQSLQANELINLDKAAYKMQDAPNRYGIEDIAEIEMGVKDVDRSIAFKQQVEIATEYFQLIAQGKDKTNELRMEELRQKLNELEERFSNDPVFVAALRAERKLYRML